MYAKMNIFSNPVTISIYKNQKYKNRVHTCKYIDVSYKMLKMLFIDFNILESIVV